MAQILIFGESITYKKLTQFKIKTSISDQKYERVYFL